MNLKAYEIEVPIKDSPSIPSGSEPPSSSGGKSDPPKRANAFFIKAKGVALVVGAIGTALTATWGAVRKPEEKVAKVGYETLAKIVEEQGKEIDKLHDDVIAIHSYLKALQDISKGDTGFQLPNGAQSIISPSASPSPIVKPAGSAKLPINKKPPVALPALSPKMNPEAPPSIDTLMH